MKTTLYMVTLEDVSNPEDRTIFTISNRKKDCELFINKLLMVENKDHFVSWCSLHDLESDDYSWEKYKSIRTTNNPYVIRKVKYTDYDIASILRMFNHCIPLGGYESDTEIAVFLNSLSKEEQEKVGKVINN